MQNKQPDACALAKQARHLPYPPARGMGTPSHLTSVGGIPLGVTPSHLTGGWNCATKNAFPSSFPANEKLRPQPDAAPGATTHP